MSWLITKVAAFAISRRFEPGQAEGLDATLELRLRVRSALVPLAITIAGGECSVRPGPAAGADAGATIGLADVVRLVIGDARGPQLLSSGRLQVSGDPFLAMRLPSLFGMTVSRTRRRVVRRRDSAAARS